MLDALFGTELSMTARVLVALLVFGVLFGAFIFILRRFGVGTLVGAAPSRGRQPRLGVTEAAPVGDGKRQLLLIRRDNIEHLVMTGGPSDVVIETNIVRASAVASTRESAPARAADALPRALPLAEGGAWQPEPGTRPSRAPVAAREEAEEEAPAEAAGPRVAAERESVRETVRDGAMRIQSSDRIAGLSDLQRNITEVPVVPPPRRGAEPRRTPPQPVPPISPSEEQNLAEMAQRLETALQRPRSATEPPPPVAPPVAAPVPRAVEPAPEPVPPAPEPKPEPRPEPKPAPKPVAKPKVASAAAFDSLEQEMASLLGRPSGKT